MNKDIIKPGNYIRSTLSNTILKVLSEPDKNGAFQGKIIRIDKDNRKLNGIYEDWRASHSWKLLKGYNTPLWKAVNE